jgi:serine/threonine-protein kinase
MDDETDGRPVGDQGDDPMEAGLRVAFGPDATASGRGGEGESVLAAIERYLGISSHLRLRAGPDEADGPNGPGTQAAGRYQIDGEIARGGIGVVLKGRDTDLGREVAIKTLRDEYAASPSMVRRLVEEAQIGGQLQHPGVLPVYEMGLDAGHRPYFAMKLIRGRTLADLLRDRPDPGHDRRRLLTIFEQVCQTLAYAHARGVIHRDLKPSNVMVGAFGEVQVVDWGLAKVLRSGGVADAPRAEMRHVPAGAGEGAIATARSGTPGPHSEAGSVLGTPAYMAPEQARGEVEGLDERCDVFALGAILCELLTGLPPYPGARPGVLREAAEGRLGDAIARLGACGAEGELVRIAAACLAAEPAGRPRDAGVVAREVSAYLASAEERARRAELEAATARARAASERRARSLTVAVGVLALLVVLIGGGAYLRIERQRVQAERQRVQAERQRVQAERQRISRLQAALALIGSLQGKGYWLITQAEAAPARDAGRWAEALALTRQAVEQALAIEADAATRGRSRALLAELRAAEANARERAASSGPAGGRRDHPR